MNFGSYITEDCSKLVIYDLLPQTTLCDFRDGTSGCQTLKIRLKKESCDESVCPEICFSPTEVLMDLCMTNIINYGNNVLEKEISLYESNPNPGDPPFERVLESINLISTNYILQDPVWNYLDINTPINLNVTNIQEWNNVTNTFENVNFFNTVLIFTPSGNNVHYLKLLKPRPSATTTNPDLKFKYFFTKTYVTLTGINITVKSTFEVDFLNNSVSTPEIYTNFQNIESNPKLEDLIAIYTCSNTLPIVDLTLQEIETCTSYEVGHTFQPADIIIPEETVFSEPLVLNGKTTVCNSEEISEYYVQPALANDSNLSYILPLYSVQTSPVEIIDYYQAVLIYNPSNYSFYNNNINQANAIIITDSNGSMSTTDFIVKDITECGLTTASKTLSLIQQNSIQNTPILFYNNNNLTNIFNNAFINSNFQLVAQFNIKRRVDEKSSFYVTIKSSHTKTGLFRRDRATYVINVPAFSKNSSLEYIKMISFEKDITGTVEWISNTIDNEHCVLETINTEYICNTIDIITPIFVAPQEVTVPAKTIQLDPIRYTSIECLTATPTVLTCAIEITPDLFCLEDFSLEALEVEIELNGEIETHCLIADCSNVICDLLKCIEKNPTSELASLYVLYTEMKNCKECSELKSILEKIKNEVANCGCETYKTC